MLDPVPKAKLADVLLASADAPKAGAVDCGALEPKEKLGGDSAEAPKLNPP